MRMKDEETFKYFKYQKNGGVNMRERTNYFICQLVDIRPPLWY